MPQMGQTRGGPLGREGTNSTLTCTLCMSVFSSYMPLCTHGEREREREREGGREGERERERGEREREREKFVDNQQLTEGRQVQRPVGQHRLWALDARVERQFIRNDCP
jgi:hypothetical protein